MEKVFELVMFNAILPLLLVMSLAGLVYLISSFIRVSIAEYRIRKVIERIKRASQ